MSYQRRFPCLREASCTRVAQGSLQGLYNDGRNAGEDNMSDLSLSMACGPYDRMEALRYGHISPDGIRVANEMRLRSVIYSQRR
jgi:hypothetical protein